MHPQRHRAFERQYFVYILASRKQGTLYIGDVRDAILREKRLKKWRWDWKIGFIEESNPEWGDLYLGLTQ